MAIKDIINSHKSEFEGVFEFYKSDLGSVRTGRATPALVESIEIEYYGSKNKIKELASISVPESRVVVIQPWDKSALDAIATGIRKSTLGIEPVTDGTIIRITIPALTEERRKEMTKVVKQKSEDAKVKIRRIREEIWHDLQEKEKNGEIREDDKFRGKDELQHMVEEYNKNVETLESKKIDELMN